MILTGCLALTAAAGQPIRIDGNTDQTAKESFARMVDASGPEKARELQVAMLLIALDGVEGTKEMLASPELRNPSIALIKDRVNGMTADQLIEISKKSTTKVDPTRP